MSLGDDGDEDDAVVASEEKQEAFSEEDVAPFDVDKADRGPDISQVKLLCVSGSGKKRETSLPPHFR